MQHWLALIHIDLYWEELIFIDWQWSAMIFIEPHFGSIPEIWSLLICIDHEQNTKLSVLNEQLHIVITSPGCYLDECLFDALSQVDPCTWTSDWQSLFAFHCYFTTEIRLLKWAKCPKFHEFLIFMNRSWPSGTHWHSAKWYPGLITIMYHSDDRNCS